MTDAPPPPPTQTPPPIAQQPATPAKQGKGCAFYGCLFTALLLIAIVATAGITVWWMQRPVKAPELTEQEEKVLEEKVEYMTRTSDIRIRSVNEAEGKMDRRLELDDPDFERKRIEFTERELNALVDKNSEYENDILVTLRPDTVLAATTFDMPEGIPVVGGRTLRLKVKVYAELRGQRLDIRVQNISLGGMPLKNSWVGGIIGKNLVDEFASAGPLKAFVEGIEEFEILDGKMVFMPAADEPVEPQP